MECTQQMASMEDDMLRSAVSASYFGSLTDAHDAYIAAGRTDLALQAHAQHGNWLQVIIILMRAGLLSDRVDCMHPTASLKQKHKH